MVTDILNKLVTLTNDSCGVLYWNNNNWAVLPTLTSFPIKGSINIGPNNVGFKSVLYIKTPSKRALKGFIFTLTVSDVPNRELFVWSGNIGTGQWLNSAHTLSPTEVAYVTDSGTNYQITIPSAISITGGELRLDFGSSTVTTNDVITTGLSFISASSNNLIFEILNHNIAIKITGTFTNVNIYVAKLSRLQDTLEPISGGSTIQFIKGDDVVFTDGSTRNLITEQTPSTTSPPVLGTSSIKFNIANDSDYLVIGYLKSDITTNSIYNIEIDDVNNTSATTSSTFDLTLHSYKTNVPILQFEDTLTFTGETKFIDYFEGRRVHYTDNTSRDVDLVTGVDVEVGSNTEVLLVGNIQDITKPTTSELLFADTIRATGSIASTLHLSTDPAGKFITGMDFNPATNNYTINRTDGTTTVISSSDLGNTGITLDGVSNVLAMGVSSGNNTANVATYNMSYDPINDLTSRNEWVHTLKVKGQVGKFLTEIKRDVDSNLYLIFNDGSKVQVPNIKDLQLEASAGSDYIVFGNQSSAKDDTGTTTTMDIDIVVPAIVTKSNVLMRNSKLVVSVENGDTVHYSDGTSETITGGVPIDFQVDPNSDASILAVGVDNTSNNIGINIYIDNPRKISYKRFDLGTLEDFNLNLDPYFNGKYGELLPNHKLTFLLFHKTMPSPYIEGYTFNPTDYSSVPTLSLELGHVKYDAKVLYIHSPSCIEYTLDHIPNDVEFSTYQVVLRIRITDLSVINQNDLTLLIKQVL